MLTGTSVDGFAGVVLVFLTPAISAAPARPPAQPQAANVGIFYEGSKLPLAEGYLGAHYIKNLLGHVCRPWRSSSAHRPALLSAEIIKLLDREGLTVRPRKSELKSTTTPAPAPTSSCSLRNMASRSRSPIRAAYASSRAITLRFMDNQISRRLLEFGETARKIVNEAQEALDRHTADHRC
jgi:hypothetical protein